MNFVGHVMAALWERDDPAFVLGSMLPDFARMCDARLQGAEHEAVAAGIACHHRTDAAFHGTETFLALCARARVELQEAGVGRATAIGAAHVGIELLLDGRWLDEPRVDAAYLDALHFAGRLPAGALRWAAPEHEARFGRLCEHLRAAGSPGGYRDPDEVGRRLHRILSRRPRLAPGPHDEPRLRQWARRARPIVLEASVGLRQELLRGLFEVAHLQGRDRGRGALS